MAKIGDHVMCQVVVIELDRPTEDGRGIYFGYTTVKLLEGRNEGDIVNMMNGSVQNVPVEERVIGRVGAVKWDNYGPYHGWMWIRK